MKEKRVLVAYASDGGGTARVAQDIARALLERGLEVDVSGVAFARALGRYDAIIVGSPHRADGWHPSAIAFLKKHRRALGSRAVWLFHVGALLSGDATKLPPDVLRLARQIAVVGVLDLMAPPIGDVPTDATLAGPITNTDAIGPLASLVAQTIARRHAV